MLLRNLWLRLSLELQKVLSPVFGIICIQILYFLLCCFERAQSFRCPHLMFELSVSRVVLLTLLLVERAYSYNAHRVEHVT